MTDTTPMLIGGNWIDAPNAPDTIEVRSPFDDRVVGRVPAGTTDHLDAAVAAAAQRHHAGALPAHQRARICDLAADALADQRDEFAGLISAEAAKPVTLAATEVDRAVDTFRFSATVARSHTGTMVPLDASVAGANKLGFTLRVPVGVVAAITPFNFPLNLVSHKVAPAIAAGCPVVLKPASATPLTALRLARLLVDDCDLPEGLLNVVTCDGSTAHHLVTHPDVAMVTFTGSAPVGWQIQRDAGNKKVSLELGNNTPVVVGADADPVAVAHRVAAGAFGFAGQSCISVQRVYVHRDIAGPFVDALVGRARDLTVGDPADPGTDLSALITPGETIRVAAMVVDAVEQGATLATGGTTVNLGAHPVLTPTVLTGVRNDMAISADEVFGPVVGVQVVDSIDEGIDLANDTRYGLQAGVFTGDLAAAIDAAHRLRFGGVTINEVPTWRADQMPYGGVGESGNTKEGPAWTVRTMTNERMVAINF